VTHRVGVIPGDGIGPEVVAEGLKVLACASQVCGFDFELVEYPWSSRLYLETNRLMPESALDEYRQLDAIFLGALGDPRVERGLLERAVVLAIRLGLDLYINLRPVVLYAERLTPLKNVQPSEVDMVVVRENTEDVYVGVGGSIRVGSPQETAIAEMVFTRRGTERAVRYAFELARTRGKQRRVTLVDKSNAIRPQEIWRRVFEEVGSEFPDIETDAVYVDAAVMYMIQDPRRFDVIVTTNLFGDIITDLGAAIQGGVGSAASGNIHPGKTSMFEPIHGSAPDIAGKDIASPIGAILAVSMMLDYLGERGAAALIENAVRDLVVSGRLPTLDARSGLGTSQVGDLVSLAVTAGSTGLNKPSG
jgi:3-isopropylmalate dehydrogenase